VHVCGAVAPLSGRTHDHISPALSQVEFAQFLRHLLAYHPGKRRLVIHDRGAQHTGAAVEEVVREASGRLMLEARPAYSPERNPQERIWKWLRRVVIHNHWFATCVSKSKPSASSSAWRASKIRCDGDVASKPRNLYLHHCRF